ncbi:MAG TPA: hypothetical protein DDW52_05240 [Planctomycetaceae bacterium]|nr:hypothetical protein [Planctomycetaceae bacterium]
MSDKLSIGGAVGVTALNLVSLAFIDHSPSFARELFLGYFFGSLFGQAALAATWMGLAPSGLLQRVGIALGWIASLPVVAAINVVVNGGPGGSAVALLTLCFVSVWAVLSLLLIAFKFVTGVSLASFGNREKPTASRQLKMRDLFVLMTIAALLVGGAKLLIQRLGLMTSEASIFAFLAAATVLFLTPLILSVLLERYYLFAVFLSLAMIVTLTFWESSLLAAFDSGPGPKLWDFVSINTFNTGLVLVVLSLVRAAGYYIPVGRSQTAPAEIDATD